LKSGVRSIAKFFFILVFKIKLYLAENLPEDQQKDVFNEGNMSPLIHTIFRAKIKENYEKEEFEQRRKRILRLSWNALSEIGFRDNAWNLAPDIMNGLIKAGLNESFDTMVGLKGIYIKGLNQSNT
jgi:hypothetical protein